MVLVAHYDLELHQMDVKIVFLNGDIEETIYMMQPENFVSGDSVYGVQTKEIHLWSQTSFPSMVSQVP
uniref:Reverse transcriptase Ty1/copia-type domain-containing protein n=1 Tax=Cajanus cajan TaxID=3821 RepID=A0A151RYW6_CAJCA|nr:hypothetical protein KK1_030595 [Cajanus cajan]